MEKIAAELLLKGLAPEGFADSQPIGLVTTDSREVCPGCILDRKSTRLNSSHRT